MVERLLELIRIKMISPSQLADAIGVQRSGISHFVSGRNKPSLEFIIKILNYFPDVNPDWLLFGKTPFFREGHEGINDLQATPSIVKNEDIYVAKIQEQGQASLLNELFSKNGKSIERNHIKKDQGVKYQSLESKSKTTFETQSPKKEKVKVSGGQSKNEREKRIERIVIFYNDQTFSEYHPE